MQDFPIIERLQSKSNSEPLDKDRMIYNDCQIIVRNINLAVLSDDYERVNFIDELIAILEGKTIMETKIRYMNTIKESQLREIISKSITQTLTEGYTQGDVNNAFAQWQQQGLQSIRQNNGGRGYSINQVGNNKPFHSIPHENAISHASALLSKAKYLYQYLMGNDIRSASQMLQPLMDLLESIESDITSYQREQQTLQQMGGGQYE